jgi:hypothetical protein
VDNTFVYHHVGIAGRDLESGIPAYEKLFGYKLILFFIPLIEDIPHQPLDTEFRLTHFGI